MNSDIYYARCRHGDMKKKKLSHQDMDIWRHEYMKTNMGLLPPGPPEAPVCRWSLNPCRPLSEYLAWYKTQGFLYMKFDIKKRLMLIKVVFTYYPINLRNIVFSD